ncbi:class II aldolase/adducin family protein [Roseococcus pinisoli]|uniref:Class II aldolase/adducin family protein n=1 Tax=Roseococcus pinisoli TaxID=2835040 RepID=A0ABS5QJ72_9PROT|nr:class II aldolase/adducin family protein [Roseococcus pinisoli]MBS7813669.1 class II aldolase/adducin family protein [Roseococcus pinisoli]
MNQISTPARRGEEFLSLLRNGPPERTPEQEQLHRKQRLAATFRLFSRYGYDQGLAGHVTARDPIRPDHFWVNPLGFHFSLIRVSDLILVNDEGEVVEGSHAVNRAAFAIHSAIHAARPDVVAAAHTHSTHGKAWSALGRRLDPLTQDSCAFYETHGLFDDFTGVVLDQSEGHRIAEALGPHKAAILKNHGLLTVGQSVEAAAWRFIALDNAARAQLLAEAAGTPQPIPHDVAKLTESQIGNERGGILSFHPLWDKITAEEPDLLG